MNVTAAAMAVTPNEVDYTETTYTLHTIPLSYLEMAFDLVGFGQQKMRE